jgi:hypothetical protein
MVSGIQQSPNKHFILVGYGALLEFIKKKRKNSHPMPPRCQAVAVILWNLYNRLVQWMLLVYFLDQEIVE